LPNKEYEFRVAAFNDAGLSDWSDNSEYIEAKNPEGKYSYPIPRDTCTVYKY